MAEYIIDKIAYNGDVYKLQDNESGYITSYTDEKVKATDLSLSTNGIYYPVLGGSSGNAETKKYSSIFNVSYNDANGQTTLDIGDNNSTGWGNIQLRKGGYGFIIRPDLSASLSSWVTLNLPEEDGTLALTSDIPTVPTISLNGSSTTSASFYAPTTAGTSGYVLSSNGSGAPSWVSAVLTDEKLKTTDAAANRGYTLYPVIGSANTSSATTKYIDTTGLKYSLYNGNGEDLGWVTLVLGNGISSDITNGKSGFIELYGAGSKTTLISTQASADDRYVDFPDKSGTVALTSDIPSNFTGSTTSSAGISGLVSAPPELVNNGDNKNLFLTSDNEWSTPFVYYYAYQNHLYPYISGLDFGSPGSRGISNYIPIALYNNDGVVRPWYTHTSASTGPTAGSDSTAVTVNAITTTAGKYYAVESDVNGRMFVNVPWSGGGDVFVATVGTTTYADVLAAYNAGKTIIVKEDYNNTIYCYYLERYSATDSIFYFGTPAHTNTSGTSKALYTYTLNSSNTWSDGSIYLDIPSITLNGTTTTYPSFYAPTTAGTSGQVLTSNGSGEPTWAAAPSGSSTQIIRWTES